MTTSAFGDAVVGTAQALTAALPPPPGWALVGGLAVSARAEPRFTRDIDLAVAVPDDAAAEALVADLVRRSWHVTAIVEQEATGRLAQVRLRPDRAGMVCDLLFASSGIEAEIAAAAQSLELVPGLTLPVATVGHLMALKLLSVTDRRQQDRMDLDSLAAVARPADWAQAAQSVALITQRGFHRDRDLASALSALRDAP
jgi:predicted nucleotidyltransferase